MSEFHDEYRKYEKEQLEARRKDFAERFIKPFIDKLIEQGILPEPEQPVKVEWTKP